MKVTEQKKDRTYNGYRSWNGWNVSLWINNDEGLYNLAYSLVKKHGARKAARILLEDFAGMKTPDGAAYNLISIYNAIKDILE